MATVEITADWLWTQLWEKGQSIPKIAEAAGVSVGTIYNRIKSYGFKTRRRGPIKPFLREGLSEAQILEIKERAARPGENKTALAKEYGISRARLYQIISGEHRALT